jgi:hypothetical protein
MRSVAHNRDRALFVDGGLTFHSGQRANAVVQPYLSLGVRYRVEGRSPCAIAALGTVNYDLEATGTLRAPMLMTATLGGDIARSERLTLFGAVSGEASDPDNRASGRIGLHLAF